MLTPLQIALKISMPGPAAFAAKVADSFGWDIGKVPSTSATSRL